MFSEKIKEGMEFTGLTYREVAKEIDINPSTLNYRLKVGYKPWNIREIVRLTALFQSKGFNLYAEQVYADILREIDEFEELIDYIPLTRNEIAERAGLTPNTLSTIINKGFTDINHIQAIKEVIAETTLFRIRERYW